MRRRTNARRPEAHRLSLRGVQIFGKRLESGLGLHQQHIRRFDQKPDMREIRDRIEGQRWHGGRRENMHRSVGYQQRIAIGGLLRDEIRADHATRASAVFNHHGLTQGLGKGRGHQAAHGIHQTAWRELRDQADGPACRPGAALRGKDARACQRAGNGAPGKAKKLTTVHCNAS